MNLDMEGGSCCDWRCLLSGLHSSFFWWYIHGMDGFLFIEGQKRSLNGVIVELNQTTLFMSLLEEQYIAVVTYTRGAFSFRVSIRPLLHLWESCAFLDLRRVPMSCSFRRQRDKTVEERWRCIDWEEVSCRCIVAVMEGESASGWWVLLPIRGPRGLHTDGGGVSASQESVCVALCGSTEKSCSEMIFCCSCAVWYPFSLRSGEEAVVLERLLTVVWVSCLLLHLSIVTIACDCEYCLLWEAGEHALIRLVWEICYFGWSGALTINQTFGGIEWR